MIEFWHNPRCSKSRQALALLQERDAELTIRNYLTDPPTDSQLRQLQKALGDPPLLTMMRKGEKRFKELGLHKDSAEQDLLAAMAANPILIERPVAILGPRAAIGRPPERVLDLLTG